MLQNFPMYAYIPAKDVSRARKFYEGTLDFKPAQEVAGGVSYEFAGGTVSHAQRRHVQGEPGVLAGAGHRGPGRRAAQARREVRGVPTSPA
jgi:extradiol dioxygenase family protein